MTNTDSHLNIKTAPGRAYILAGGASSRMGCDKLFVSVDGEPLLAHTLRICRAAFDQVSIVAKDSEKFGEFKAPVLIDFPDAPGPLGGVIAALDDCSARSADSCFIIAADLADIDEATIQTLQQNYHGEDYLGISESGRIQPLCGIYATKALSKFRQVALKNDPYQLWRIVEGLNYRLIPMQKTSWRNINTPADIHQSFNREEAR